MLKICELDIPMHSHADSFTYDLSYLQLPNLNRMFYYMPAYTVSYLHVYCKPISYCKELPVQQSFRSDKYITKV